MSDDTGRSLNMWILGLTLGIVVAIAALIVKGRLKGEQEVKAAEPTPIAVMTVKKEIATESVTFSGRVVPVRDVMVATEIPGRFLEMPVDVGSVVKAGDLLIKIDDALQIAAMARAAAEFGDAERELKRAEKLAKTGAVSTSILESAGTRMVIASAGRDEAAARLRKCSLTSPIDGRVEERFVETGEYAGDGNIAFRVADMSQVKVIVFVPEADIVDVEPGKTMKFSVGAYPESRFEGKVVFAARAVDAVKHSFRVELLAENSDGRLLGGMIASVTLERSTHQPVVEIPFVALLARKGEHIVFTCESDRAVRKTVRIHALAGESALISKGLSDGEMLIVEGQRSLQDGKPVQVEGDAGAE